MLIDKQTVLKLYAVIGGGQRGGFHIYIPTLFLEPQIASNEKFILTLICRICLLPQKS